MQLSLTVDEIAAITGPARTAGETTGPIQRIAALKDAGPGDLSFLANTKYRKEVAGSEASIILVPEDFEGEPREGQAFFFQENTSLALARVCARIEQRLWPRPAQGIHPTAVVHERARIAPTASVGPLCIVEEGATVGEHAVLQGQVFVGRGVAIGDDSFLAANVTVQGHCRLGARVRLHPGVVIGADGFGYDTGSDGRHRKLPQVGEVVIGDDVEIGAGTTIDRARFDRTEIGEGTKIDNLVQIGHNVLIGKYCLIVAQVGVAGSTVIEDQVIIGGQAGISGHLSIGRGSMIAAKAGISKTLPPKSYVAGVPALPIMLDHRLNALRKRLPDLFRDFEELDAAVKKLFSKS